MPRLKRHSSREVVRALSRLGFEVASMRGSHAKLVRVSEAGQREILVVPMHGSLTVGTLAAIHRQASKYLSLSELRATFFTE